MQSPPPSTFANIDAAGSFSPSGTSVAVHISSDSQALASESSHAEKACRLPHRGQVIRARDGEVVVVDGGRGCQLIDLRCYDVSVAKFRDNMIEIDCGHQGRFVVAHRNVHLAVFRDDVFVDL